MLTIEQEIEFHVKWATDVMRRQGELFPMAMVDGDAGRLPVMMNFATPEQKDSNYSLIKLIALAYDATQIIMLAESWITILDKDGAVERRTEALTITIVRRDGERSVSMEIQRDEAGGFAGLLPDQSEGGVTLESRISRALPKEPVSEWQQRSARDVLKLLGVDPAKHAVH